MDITILYLLLYICAAVCFFLYSFDGEGIKVNLLGLGVLFWSLVPLIQTLHKL